MNGIVSATVRSALISLFFNFHYMNMCDSFKKLSHYSGWALLFARLVVGGIFILHGLAKFKVWEMMPNEQVTSGMLNLMKFLSIVEPLAGLALILGFLTQFAAAGLGILMIGAMYFKQFVWQVGFTSASTTGWEFDLVLLALCVVLFFAGSGRIALENVVCKKYCKHI